MTKWWNKTPGDFWMELFARERTRWIAVVLFLCGTALANWMAVDAALEGRTFRRFGSTVSVQAEPLQFSFWITWRTIIAVAMDVMVLWTVIALWRGRRARLKTSGLDS